MSFMRAEALSINCWFQAPKKRSSSKCALNKYLWKEGKEEVREGSVYASVISSFHQKEINTNGQESKHIVGKLERINYAALRLVV